MLLPEAPTAKPHFNICVSSDRGEEGEYLNGEGGPVWAEGGERLQTATSTQTKQQRSQHCGKLTLH